MREVERRKPKEMGRWVKWRGEELEEQDPWSVGVGGGGDDQTNPKTKI